jgi:hypothetical protein
MRNRIINGAMVIDQRNAGASVTINAASFTYTLDRWRSFGQATDGVFTVQQDTSAPSGFVNSAKITVTTADTSIGVDQGYNFQQSIEGYNTADLGFGTANAKTVTLSFWVRSSLTGTFGGALRNSANNRTYPFSYTISSVDTWEQKSVTIAGDTTGTWLTTNGTGINVLFSLGAGSDFLTTGGSWNAVNRQGVTGQVNLIGTNGATFYITGVQLEKGTQATSFEYRQYQQELALCQRYYYKISGGAASRFGVGHNSLTTAAVVNTTLPVTMRIAPTALEQSGTAGDYDVQHGNTVTVCSSVPTFSICNPYMATVVFPVASGLTAGQGSNGRAVNTSAFLAWSAEL